MTSLYDDHLFVRGLKEGSELAYRELYRRFHDRLLFTCYQRVRDRHASEDIVSECLSSVFENKPDFDSADHVKNYLFKSLYYISSDYLKRSSRQADYIKTIGGDEPLEVSLEEAIIRADYINHLRKLIEELPAKQRDTLKALFLDEKKYKEVAAELGMSSLKNVEKTRKRGILNLVKRFHPSKAAEMVFIMLSILLTKK